MWFGMLPLYARFNMDKNDLNTVFEVLAPALSSTALELFQDVAYCLMAKLARFSIKSFRQV